MPNIKWKPEFKHAGLYNEELQSIRSMVEHYSVYGTRREKRIIKNLYKALLWIEREMWIIENVKQCEQCPGFKVDIKGLANSIAEQNRSME